MMHLIWAAKRREPLMYVECVFCVRCNASTTLFPTACTANSTQIAGELLLAAWHLDFTYLYVDYLVIVGIIIVSRCAAYSALRLMPPYQTTAV